jgi:hypothetical protein
MAGLVLVLVLAVLPFGRERPRLYGPVGVLGEAPRGVTEALGAETSESDRLYAPQGWGSWFELALPGVPVMVDTRIELFERETWDQYLAVSAGRADWSEILERWGVVFVALKAGDAELRPLIAADPGWELVVEDEEGVVYRRTQGA